MLEPVSWLPEAGRTVTRWSVGDHRDRLRHRVGAQGLSAVPGALLPQRLQHTLPAGEVSVGVVARRGSVDLDGLIVRPLISEADFGTGANRTSLFVSIAPPADPTRGHRRRIRGGPQLRPDRAGGADRRRVRYRHRMGGTGRFHRAEHRADLIGATGGRAG